jgi:hypothetical protein
LLAAVLAHGLAGITLVFLGLLMGYLIGTIIGIIIINKAMRYYGSLLFAVIGCLLCAIIAVILETPLNLGLNPIILVAIFFLGIPLFTVIGLYLKRKPRESVQ